MLIEEVAGWLDAMCSASLLSQPRGALHNVRNLRSSETANAACCRGAEKLVMIGGVGLWKQGGRHEECASGPRSLCGGGTDKRTRDKASKMQGLIM